MSAPDWKQIAEREHHRLAGRFTNGQIKNIARTVEGILFRETLTPQESAEVDNLLRILRGEFTPGLAIILARELHKTASKSERQLKSK